MKNGFLDPAVLSFVFAPLIITVALLLALWRKKMSESCAAIPAAGTAGRLLAAAVAQMPEERRDWGAAMLAELGSVRRLRSRWRFAFDCARVALFPPRRATRTRP